MKDFMDYHRFFMNTLLLLQIMVPDLKDLQITATSGILQQDLQCSLDVT